MAFLKISGTAPFVSDLAQLETLKLDIRDESAELAETWLEGNCRSLLRLRTLHVLRVSVESLVCILDNSSDLMEFACYYDLVDEHLRSFSRLASASLKTLCLINGRFTPLGLSAFIAAFPPSITRLELSRSDGLTPSNFRSLLQLPSLRHLTVVGMYVDPDDLLELEQIAKNEPSPGLRVEWRFMTRTS